MDYLSENKQALILSYLINLKLETNSIQQPCTTNSKFEKIILMVYE